jgi:DNA invertase Pin-like site-specific DNA recombinase
LLDRIESNGVRTVIVEDASRFARQLVVQEAGVLALVERGVRVLTAGGDDLTETDDPFKIAMRQIAGVFAQLEKTRLVGKLKAARDRKRATGVKVEGRKSHGELRPEVVAEARRLRRSRPKGGQRSLRDVAAELAQLGYLNEAGKPYGAEAIRRMCGPTR